jgi:hypothetical protein
MIARKAGETKATTNDDLAKRLPTGAEETKTTRNDEENAMMIMMMI